MFAMSLKIFGLIKLSIALIVAVLIRAAGGARGLWVICERPDEARDNGYQLFKYVRTHHPEVPIYYLISADAPDYDRVARLGQVIHWGSYRHYLYWCLAECVISAHAGKCAPESHFSWRTSRAGIVSHKSVFLNHGITAINCPEFVRRSEASHHMFNAAAPAEQEYLTEVAGHEPGVVQLLGLCRFDALHEPVEVRRQVLLMPTWRRWFRGLVEEHGHEEATHIFRKSEYFKAYHAILQSDRLHRALEEEHYELIFYPHYGVQEYLGAFGPTHERITIADRQHYDVQQLLKESAVLITDFSSVSFDFAYMGKPLVYVLPDEERYFSDHFQRGYFDFDRDGFGPVTRDPETAVVALETILRRGAAQEPLYQERVEAFFPLRDDQNCERTFAAIREVVEDA